MDHGDHPSARDRVGRLGRMDEPKDRPAFGGMTVNERLVVAGLTDEFDDAMNRRDRAEAIRILESVDVADAAWSVDTMLANPTFYGFSN